MNVAEGERLAVMETKVSRIEIDVAEIKSDVKTIVQSQAEVKLALAAEQAADKAHQRSRADLGVWVRVVLPLVVAIGALAVSAYNLLLR